jgi:hypothetical protein
MSAHCKGALTPGRRSRQTAGIVKVLVDEAVPEDKRGRIVQIVTDLVQDRPDADTLVVSVVKMSPGRGWSIFINDLQDSPVIAEIQAAMKKAGF